MANDRVAKLQAEVDDVRKLATGMLVRLTTFHDQVVELRAQNDTQQAKIEAQHVQITAQRAKIKAKDAKLEELRNVIKIMAASGKKKKIAAAIRLSIGRMRGENEREGESECETEDEGEGDAEIQDSDWCQAFQWFGHRPGGYDPSQFRLVDKP
jgi:hypothetical protein